MLFVRRFLNNLTISVSDSVIDNFDLPFIFHNMF